MDWRPGYIIAYQKRLEDLNELAQELQEFVRERDWVDDFMVEQVQILIEHLDERRAEISSPSVMALELFGWETWQAISLGNKMEDLLKRLKISETHLTTKGYIRKKEDILHVTGTRLSPLLPCIVKDNITYKVEIDSRSRIGGGSFGQIFMGTCELGPIAAKCPYENDGYLTAEQKEKIFEIEAEVWRDLRHDHVLEFYGVTTFMKSTYLISPFMKNGSVRKYLANNKDSTLCRAKIARDVADGLAFLHKEKIVHGDMKADNILLDDRLNALICDFGLAKLPGTGTASALKGIGSGNWKAPELWGDSISDVEPSKTEASDTYAFGLTIYEILSGNAPFLHLTVYALGAAHQGGLRPPREPRNSPSGWNYDTLWDIAARCWAMEPSDRPPMFTIYQELNAITTAEKCCSSHGVQAGGITVDVSLEVAKIADKRSAGSTDLVSESLGGIIAVPRELSGPSTEILLPHSNGGAEARPWLVKPAARPMTTEEFLRGSANFRPFRSNMSSSTGLELFKDFSHWAVRRQASRGFSGTVSNSATVN